MHNIRSDTQSQYDKQKKKERKEKTKNYPSTEETQ